jgi:IS5 family transposase
MRKFVGVTTDADIIPDETTILRFRRLLEIHQLTEALFAEVNGLLSERGLFVGKGTIVDEISPRCTRYSPSPICIASDIVCWLRRRGASMKCKKRRNRHDEARNRGAEALLAHIFLQSDALAIGGA